MTLRTALVAFVVLAGRTAAAEMDKPRLRRLADLPTISVIAGVGFSTSNGFYFNDAKPDPLAEIARLRKELKGDDSDVERYLRLGLFYFKADRKKESKDAYAKAIALCRRQVKEHPDDMHRLAQLGDALFRNGEDKEAEALMRRAVKAAPNEWLAWLTLGKCVDLRAIGAVLEDEHDTLHLERLMDPARFAKKPKAEQIAEMRRLRQEATRCFDRAIELAPRETKAYLWRICSLCYNGVIDARLREAQGEHVNRMAAMFTPACAADTRCIARLSPDDPKSVGTAVIVEVYVCIQHDQISTLPAVWLMPPPILGSMNGMAAPDTTKDISLVDALPKQSRDFVNWGLDRLEQLTSSADKNTAADASEVLANALIVIHLAEHDSKHLERFRSSAEKAVPKIVKHLRRAVHLDPTRERAWDFLTVLLADKDQAAKAAVVARRRIESKDNAHNRFMLAKVYADLDKYEDAAKELRAGLKYDKNDLNCRLGLAAALLRRDDGEALKQAGKQLALASRMKQESESRRKHYFLLRGLHAALSDRPDQAKKLFHSALRQDADNTKAAKALAALGAPIAPADESLAIAYLRARKGEIERADNQPDSPVVKIRLTDDKIADIDLFFLSAFPQLCDLQLASDSIADAGLVHLKRLPSLRRLNLGCKKITNKGLIHLKALTNLRSLDLEFTKVTDAGLVHLETIRSLESLWLPDTPDCGDRDKKPTITTVGLSHLRKLPNLRNVSLSQPLSDEGLAQLSALPHLQKLFAIYSKITDDGMKHFEQCTQLRELRLSGTEITDAGLVHLKGLRQLRKLHLDNTKITDAGLVHLKGLRQFRELHLYNTKITDAGLAHLKGLTDLEYLDLNDTLVTNAGLVHLHGLSHLRTLNLGEPYTQLRREIDLQLMSFLPGQESKPATKPAKPRITDAGLEHLQGLTALETLDLTGRPLTDSGLTHLKHLHNLRCLFLDSKLITDTGLAHIEQFPRLERLCLRETNITDAGLTHLYKLKQLKYVSLDKTKVTSKGIVELRKVFPKLDMDR